MFLSYPNLTLSKLTYTIRSTKPGIYFLKTKKIIKLFGDHSESGKWAVSVF
jgi:hypothetical protein